MDLQLSVHVRIDPDHKRVRLITTGHLTETNQQALYPLIHHARTLTADTEVVIDLTAVGHLEAGALDLLCWEVEHDDTGSSTRPVRFDLTEPPPTGRPPWPPAGKVRRTGSTAWTPRGPASTTRSFSNIEAGHQLLVPRARPVKGRTTATAAARPPHRSPVETATLISSAVFLVAGLAGFIPGLTTGYASLELAGHHSEAMFLGLFQTSVLHNIVHLLYGIVGAAMARSAARARNYLRWGGAVYLVLWLYGLLVSQQSPANFLPLNTADDWLHLFLGVTMVGLSFLGRGPIP